ncbi:MAG: hypothetical protein ABFR35_08870 [Thermodesulfobacteriota bacterium]
MFFPLLPLLGKRPQSKFSPRPSLALQGSPERTTAGTLGTTGLRFPPCPGTVSGTNPSKWKQNQNYGYKKKYAALCGASKKYTRNNTMPIVTLSANSVNKAVCPEAVRPDPQGMGQRQGRRRTARRSDA